MNDSVFCWFPRGFAVDETAKVRRLLSSGPGVENPEYQIVDTVDRKHVCLLLKLGKEKTPAIKAAEQIPGERFSWKSFASHTALAAAYPRSHAPMRVGSIPLQRDFLTAGQLSSLADALQKIRSFSWSESVFLPGDRVCVPFGNRDSLNERHELCMRLVTGGVADLSLSVKRISAINPWVTEREAREFFRRAGIEEGADTRTRARAVRPPEEFFLPGQPEIERVFRERIIEYYSKPAVYEKMGVAPPNGILLEGPPGSGKTYAVRCLVEFLDWPLFELSIGKQGSPYIHQTSTNIRKAFQDAIRKAPSVLFIDELEALGSARDNPLHSHKTEEIAELLQQMDSIGKKHVVVLAATNLPRNIDDALKRKGRFDVTLKVPYPGVDGILAVIKHCLSLRPHEGGLDLHSIAQRMEHRPLADIEQIVNDAGRIAVQAKKQKIDMECLLQAAPKFEDSEDPHKYVI